MKMVKVRNATDHEREVQVGVRGDGPWIKVASGATLEVREEVAYGWPATDESCAIGGLLDQPDNWQLADEQVVFGEGHADLSGEDT